MWNEKNISHPIQIWKVCTVATSNGANPSSEGERQIKPSAKIFFVNKKLFRYISANRGNNIVYLYNITDQKEQTMLYSDFKKHRKRAYTVIDTARLLNRSANQLRIYIRDGSIKPPMGILPDGERSYTRKSYYSEEDIFEIRNFLATLHIGRPRKDGKVSNNILTEQELRAKMGDALILYTRTKDGEFIPVWAEQTY
jgi:hypothetical protein